MWHALLRGEAPLRPRCAAPGGIARNHVACCVLSVACCTLRGVIPARMNCVGRWVRRKAARRSRPSSERRVRVPPLPSPPTPPHPTPPPPTPPHPMHGLRALSWAPRVMLLVARSYDNKWLAVGHETGTVVIWDVKVRAAWRSARACVRALMTRAHSVPHRRSAAGFAIRSIRTLSAHLPKRRRGHRPAQCHGGGLRPAGP